jgi:hypothetical protein
MIGLYMATENPGLHRLDDRFIHGYRESGLAQAG